MDTKCVIADRKCALLAQTVTKVDFGHISDHPCVCRHPATADCSSPVLKYCQIYKAFGRDEEENKSGEKHFDMYDQHKATSLLVLLANAIHHYCLTLRV